MNESEAATHECTCSKPAPASFADRMAALHDRLERLSPEERARAGGRFTDGLLAGMAAGSGRVAESAAAMARAAAATEPFNTPFPTPEYPERDWFERPTWVAAYREEHGLGSDVENTPAGPLLKLTVTDEGRIGGWFYEHGQCIVHMQDACPKPSPTRYAAFMQNDVVLDDGSMIRCGVIGNTHGHASPWVDWREAQRHYADPSAQMILCTAGDDERGGWIAGALVPGLTYGDVAMIRRSGLSGDWRPMPATWFHAHSVSASIVREVEGYDCIGPTLVTRPALPLTAGGRSAGRRRFALAASVWAGPVLPPEIATVGMLPAAMGGVEMPEGRTTTINPDGSIKIVETRAKAPGAPEEEIVDPVVTASAPAPVTAAPATDELPPAAEMAEVPDEEMAPEGDAETRLRAVEDMVGGFNERLTAVEEFLSAQLESQMASILKADGGLPDTAELLTT